MPALRGRRTGDLRVVVNVVIPRHLSKEQRELVEQLADSMTDHNLRTDEGVFGKLKRAFGGLAATRMLRLAVRVRREQAEIVLAELLALAPSGVEEVRPGAGVVEYAVYGAPGELPALPDLRAAAGGALVEVRPTEVADDWDRAVARVPQAARARVAGCRCGRRGRPRAAPPIELVIDPGPGVRDRRARHHPAVPGVDARARVRRRRRVPRPRLRVGRAGDRGGPARLGAGGGARLRPAERRGGGEQRARERGARSRCAGTTCGSIRWRSRRRSPRTCCGRCCWRGRRGWRRGRRRAARARDRQRAAGRRGGRGGRRVRGGRACRVATAAPRATGPRCCSNAAPERASIDARTTCVSGGRLRRAASTWRAARAWTTRRQILSTGPMRPSLAHPVDHVASRLAKEVNPVAQPARDRRDARWPAPRRASCRGQSLGPDLRVSPLSSLRAPSRGHRSMKPRIEEHDIPPAAGVRLN